MVSQNRLSPLISQTKTNPTLPKNNLSVSLKPVSKPIKKPISRFGLAVGNWSFINNGSACPNTFPGGCMQDRHENGFVQAGGRFYLVGGRETPNHVNIYNPQTNLWSLGAIPPIPLHHFQAVNYDGLIYVIGGFTGDFPSEPPLTKIYIYNPLKDNWIEGSDVPSARRRGAAGAVVYNDKIYVVSGNILGHKGITQQGQPTHVTWFDEFDPTTNTWLSLPNAPRARDHFQVAVVNDKLYAVAGRRSNHLRNTPPEDFLQTFANTEPKVDVYDFVSGTWTTLANDLPTERAGAAVAVLGNELLVIGGESLAQTLAHNQNEALNVSNNTWRTLDPLQQGRHGTQAIVNNGGVYIATGSHRRGDGVRLSQEVFFLGSSTAPILNSLTASQLNPSQTEVNFGQVPNGQMQEQTLSIAAQNGNQGIIIQSINLAAGSHADFDLDIPFSLPIHLRPGSSLSFKARINSSGTTPKTGTIQIAHSGANASVEIDLSNQAAPLAVGMLNFAAQRTSPKQVKLTWSTFWERENKGFVVERSQNSKDFVAIGFVEGRGNQNQVQQYAFDDLKASGAYYYRLKQLDWSGDFEYSTFSYVEASSALVFRVFPNPAAGQLAIDVSEDFDRNEQIKWQVIDNQGLTIKQGQGNVESLQTDLQDLVRLYESGQVLHLQAVVGKRIFHQRIIIQ
jgi:N-acetylneuraminic acid mutarotase